MELIIRNTSSQPIYDQIASQIKAQIISGALAPGDALPSIRGLAKDLKISVITTKRAYDELETQGFLNTVAGKGCFVAEKNLTLIRGQKLRRYRGGADRPAAPRMGGIAMTNAIELKHIEKSFGEFTLRDVSLSIPTGTICGLVGENGAGKSTLIRILMGALRPDSGAAVTLGADVSAPDFLRVKEDIGVVLDEGCFPESLTAPQVGKIMAATYRRWEPETFSAYCKRFALPEKTAFKDYSRGMKMKLTIAAALSHQAKLLVLDEATAGLDPIVRDEILDLFSEFTRDETHSVLISSHILSDLEKICDYVAFLHQGQLLFCEEKDALLEQYGIFNDTAEQAEALMPEAIVSMETTPYGGVRALVRRELAPVGFQLEKPTIEDIILALVKGEKQ